MPLVSVIIPNYNHALFLEQRLNSVFDQTFQDFEVILLDDASTDSSQEILSSYKNHYKVSHIIFNETNSGSPFKQWQKGINLAKGEYIWIAESDDYCELDFLDTVFNDLDDAYGLCYLQSLDVDEKETVIYERVNYTDNFQPNIWKSNFELKGSLFIENYLSVKNVVPNASAVVFKRCLVNEALFDFMLLDMRMCGDWLFWIRICEQTTIKFINKNLNFFRHHTQVSRNHNNLNKKKERLLEESVIREHLKNNRAFINFLANKQLYVKWFKLHTKRDLFRSGFYTICHTFWKKFALAFQFIYFKFDNY